MQRNGFSWGAGLDASRCGWWIGAAALFLAIAVGSVQGAEPPTVHHDLAVRLLPEIRTLTGEDRMTLRGSVGRRLVLRLSERATVEAVRVSGDPVDHTLDRGRLAIPLPDRPPDGTVRVTVRYRAVFDDPVPVRPDNTDNPGYGVTGTISERGVFLLAGAGWYPDLDGAEAAFSLSVTAPAGVLAVTAGRSTGHVTQNGATTSGWQVDRSVAGLSLSAARYVVDTLAVGTVTAATYFLEENRHLAADYLKATASYLDLYARMFGPYPFAKFAVVENFFPTGYGFPSYTLLGGSVLRLPFIISTSLGHEIAHCWWGNGVLVDPAGGNWSEGLTAYVADYFYKEQASPEATVEYRRQLLRNYADLVSPQNDIPLARFSSRRDPATKAVGYDKAAMVFHMIRRNLGEDAFWGALRDVYAQRLFVPTGWQDLRAAFERRGRTSLDRFFREWVDRPGALELSLDRVTAEPAAGGGWTVSGRIRQQEPVYDVDLELAVETDLCTLTPTVTLRGADTSFAVHLDEPPRTLALDPAYEVFRRLHPSEMPPSVNSLKGSESVLMVVPEKMDPALAAAADLLPRALGLERVERVPGGDLTPDLAAGRDLLFVGVAPSGAAGPEVPGQVEWTDASFTLNGSRYADPADVFFGVFSHPATVGRVAAVFLPLSGRYTVTVARKIPHYGKYSYLAFTAGQNRDKGVWAVADSPLIFRWPREQRTTEVTQ